MQYIIATYISEQYQVKYFLLILTRVKLENIMIEESIQSALTIFLEILNPKKKKSIGLGLIA